MLTKDVRVVPPYLDSILASSQSAIARKLQLNVRPGVSIQLATRRGLRPLITAVEQRIAEALPVLERMTEDNNLLAMQTETRERIAILYLKLRRCLICLGKTVALGLS